MTPLNRLSAAPSNIMADKSQYQILAKSIIPRLSY